MAGEIYVDKTAMISVMNRFIDRGNSYVCISRPRRFGKTIAGNMLAAYYSKGCQSEELFSGLNIARCDGYKEKLNKYHVIQIDINSEYQNAEEKGDLIKSLIRNLKREMREGFPRIEFRENANLAEMMLEVYSKTGEIL